MSDLLSSAIKTLTKTFLDEASIRVSKKFNITIEESMNIWKDLYNDLETIPSVSKIVPRVSEGVPIELKISKIPCNSSDDEEKENPKCIHILTRGPNNGLECGKKISNKSQTGTYCIVHLNQENRVKISKKEIKDSKKSKIVRDPNFGTYINIETNLVFKSRNEKIVIGRQDDIGDIHRLNEEDVENCKNFKFVYDKTCVEDYYEKNIEED